MNTDTPWSIETAPARVAKIQARIKNKDPQLASVFTQTFFDTTDEQIEALSGRPMSDLAGALVSIKDLLDVEGYVTKAGTLFMKDNQAALGDADSVTNLRNAGAIFVGHTNMTELAYSGLGLNPHYGTPTNALREGCIPGGSTSGGAISVACGAADIAIGTDTGGSLRIPAAFNGIVGFKPTQSTVSQVGCKPLSRSLDSVGPMAKSVAVCKLAYEILAGDDAGRAELSDPTLVVPTNYGMADLAPEVAAGFEAAIRCLRDSGYKIIKENIDVLERLKSLPVWHFSAVESRGDYDDAYQNHRDRMDPRVVSPTRMGRADEVDAVSYRKTLNLREDLIGLYQSQMRNKILLMPTVPILPPTFAEMESDEHYSRMNLQVLRNPSIGNVMDCCSVSLPFAHRNATIGVMMTACAGHDLALLDLAGKIEARLG